MSAYRRFDAASPAGRRSTSRSTSGSSGGERTTSSGHERSQRPFQPVTARSTTSTGTLDTELGNCRNRSVAGYHSSQASNPHRGAGEPFAGADRHDVGPRDGYRARWPKAARKSSIALDKRIEEITKHDQYARFAPSRRRSTPRSAKIDRTLGNRALEVAGTLDDRIAKFEELLIGRAEKLAEEVETRTRAAAGALDTSNDAIRNSTENLERMLMTVSAGVGEGLSRMPVRSRRPCSASAPM